MNRLVVSPIIAAVCATVLSLQSFGALPVEYRQLKYIESTVTNGLQYINTGVNSGQDISFYIRMDLLPQPTDTRSRYLGANAGLSLALLNGGELLFSGQTILKPCQPGVIHDILMYYDATGTRVVNLDGNVTRGKTSTQSNTILLFAMGQDASGSPYNGATATDNALYGKIYAVRIWKGETVIREMVPCQTRCEVTNGGRTYSEGTVGLYDIVNDKFYANANAQRSGSFVAGAPLPAITVTGSPAECGEPDPGYGEMDKLEKGQTYTFNPPADGEGDGAKWHCTGWKFETEGGEPIFGTGAANVTYEENGTLTWLFERQFKVAASADGGGSVSPSEQWVAEGGQATIVATPAEGKAFGWWTGDVPPEAEKSSTLELPVDGSKTVVASFVDGGTLLPDDDIAAAVEGAQPGDVISLSEGTFVLTAAVTIPPGVTLRGAGRERTIIDGGKRNLRAFVMTDAESKVEKLTICNYARSSTGYSESAGGVVNMTAGTLSDVVISNNTESSGNVYGVAVTLRGDGRVVNCLIQNNRMTNGSGGGYGAGVYMTGGSVEDCTFIGNTMSHYGSCGGGVYAKGGTISRCYFSGNGAGDGSYSDVHGTGGCGFYLNGTATAESCMVVSNRLSGVYVTGGGTVKNTVITGHKTNSSSSAWPAGVYLKNGNLYNCTICGNSALCEGGGLQMDAGIAKNNIIYDNGSLPDVKVAAGCTFECNLVDALPAVGKDNLATNPLLSSPETLDFSLTTSSPALNRGATLEEVPADITGVTRPQGDAYDIGAYELELKDGDIICSIVILQEDWPYRQKPRVSSQVIGAPDDAVLSYAWYLDGAEVAGEAGPDVEFQQLLACGAHDVRLMVTVNGVEQQPVEKVGAIHVRPTEVFVAADGGNVPPYESAEHAARSLDDALAAVWLAGDVTGVVHVAVGDYAITKAILFSTPCQLLGAGREVTKIDASAVPSTSPGLKMGDGSVVRDLTFHGMTSQKDGAGFYLSGGWVDNVCISNITQTGGGTCGVGVYMSGGVLTNSVVCKTKLSIGGGSGYGGGVYLKDGLVTDCQFFGNRSGRYGYMGGGVYLAGGTVRRCDIRDCGCSNWQYGGVSSCGGAGLFVNGANAVAEQCTVVSNLINGVYLANGTLRNSLIYGNGFVGMPSYAASATDNAGGGVHLVGGKLYNCTVAANTNLQTAATSDLAIRGGTAKNNIGLIVDGTSATSADNCFGEDPSFKNAAAYDFHLTARSTNCIKKGSRLDYTAEARDLDGNPRCRGSRVDLGCYAFIQGFSLVIR